VGTNLGQEVREALRLFGLPILKTEICQRIALCEAGIVGQTIYEYARKSQAAWEFETLAKEVIKWRNQN
jgi:chromosome partitioning protein